MAAMIEVNDVTMRYRMANDRIHNLKDFVVMRLKGQLQYRDFEALKHVSFTVEPGDTMGLVGRNGAGKSTMLKLISGIMRPTEGSVTVRGNIIPLLELGSGFDFDMTGRENVYLNGAILGYTEDFLKSKFEEILDFSELGEFINVPIRNYSSGMIVRLGFSIATVMEPEILIVDEVLAVGDAKFQEKSKARMKQLMSGGTTVLFVSHALGLVRELCNKVVWLDHGQVVMAGDTKEVCDAYERS